MAFPRALPAEFIGVVDKHLRPKEGDNPVARLPFVGPVGSVPMVRHWNVPATGGYRGGYVTGEALALVFLKHQRADLSDGIPTVLTHIVTSFMCRFENEGGRNTASGCSSARKMRFDSFHGQYVGFLNTLAGWCKAGVQVMGSRLDVLSEQELLDAANTGLAFDEVAFLTAEGNKLS